MLDRQYAVVQAEMKVNLARSLDEADEVREGEEIRECAVEEAYFVEEG